MELIQEYTFDNFIVGPSNRFTYTASLAVAEYPGKVYNPLYIYGRNGLGKTHLINAIGNSVKEKNSDMEVIYTYANEFTDTMIESLRRGIPMSEFRDEYHNADLLLIEDIHFVHGMSGTQEELFRAIEALQNAKKQIVLTSNRPLKDIALLDERLKDRFEWSLVTVIEPPEVETRIAILRKKNEELGKSPLPDDVAMLIANRVTDNMGQFKGCLLNAWARVELDNVPLSVDLVKEVLKDVTRA